MAGQLRSPALDVPEYRESGGVAVAGSFTLDLFREKLTEHPFSEAFRDRITWAAYGQLTPFLLTAPQAGTVILLVRWEDWFRHAGGREHQGLSPRAAVREFTERLASFCARHTCRVLLVVCPSPPDGRASGGDPETALAEEELARRVARLPAVTAAWAEGWAGHLETGEVHDPYLDQLAHLPYTETFLALLADRVAGLLTTGNEPAVPPAADEPAAGWAGPPGPAPGPDRTFRRLVDQAGDLRAANGGTGIVPLAWRPWLPADTGDGRGWARCARALDAVLGDLVAALRAFRLHSGRPLMVTVPPRERVSSPLTNVFGHAEDSLCRITADMADVTVAWATSRDSGRPANRAMARQG
ncbi:hypothetical protein [Streptomyces sp. Rer75]|uniref:hypothetical protein n=1 Tax=Streptomyces sp. Rer75 TaxID=2750011 RepID=UPI0015D0C4FF|nr:hypothetical protein [Streptomyces sp. Rer75]QLH25631.1 hypothetical protein HYQ63_37665 [Streptomyces sp. Rer75]